MQPTIKQRYMYSYCNCNNFFFFDKTEENSTLYGIEGFVTRLDVTNIQIYIVIAARQCTIAIPIKLQSRQHV